MGPAKYLINQSRVRGTIAEQTRLVAMASGATLLSREGG